MRRKEQDVIDSARRFVEGLRPEDRLALVLFADKVEFVHDLSTNRQMTHKGIEGYRAVGGTALYDALADALVRLKAAGEGRHVVVVMTDGRDEDNPGTAPGSVRTFADVLKQQQETRATVFPIGLGTQVDAALLQQLADVSGGRAFFPETVEELGREYDRVIEDLRRRYVVGYTSTLMERDGRWRNVEIRVKDRPDATVRTSGGYHAPGP
jgi:Ca-activated chloride channel homolog